MVWFHVLIFTCIYYHYWSTQNVIGCQTLGQSHKSVHRLAAFARKIVIDTTSGASRARMEWCKKMRRKLVAAEIHGENACLACRWWWWWVPISCWNMECRFILWIRSRNKLFCDSVHHGCFFLLICSLYVVRNRSFAGNAYGVYAICSASQPKKIFIVGNVNFGS